MSNETRFEDMPRRGYLDSSILQTLQDYGGFMYENGALADTDPIRRDPNGIAKLEALRVNTENQERVIEG